MNLQWYQRLNLVFSQTIAKHHFNIVISWRNVKFYLKMFLSDSTYEVSSLQSFSGNGNMNMVNDNTYCEMWIMHDNSEWTTTSPCPLPDRQQSHSTCVYIHLDTCASQPTILRKDHTQALWVLPWKEGINLNWTSIRLIKKEKHQIKKINMKNLTWTHREEW